MVPYSAQYESRGTRAQQAEILKARMPAVKPHDKDVSGNGVDEDTAVKDGEFDFDHVRAQMKKNTTQKSVTQEELQALFAKELKKSTAWNNAFVLPEPVQERLINASQAG